MASEISATCSLSASKGGASINTASLSKTIDMAGTFMDTGVQNIGTSNEVLAVIADVTQPIHLVVKNLDATNYVEIFRDNANAQLISKLMPGQFCLVLGLNVIPFGRANTAATNIQYWAIQI